MVLGNILGDIWRPLGDLVAKHLVTLDVTI
jgi:hypothetical protein